MEKPLTSIKQWASYFRDVGLTEGRAEIYLRYVAKLLQSKVPVIFDDRQLAMLLGKTPDYLASVIYGTYAHYREFSIPKRSGGKRKINSPYPALLECQDWVHRHILSAARKHKAAHGFVQSKSIISNASPHVGAKCVLRVDVTDFFPSIHISRVIKVFRELGYSRRVSFSLGRLCCLNDALPQGAATSPMLSNIISYDLDVRLSALARHLSLNYTRYADDLTFSGEKIGITLSSLIEEILNSEGFKVNRKKTVLMRNTSRKFVTGIDVSGRQLRIPRKYRRAVRQEAHFVIKFGLRSHAQKVRRHEVGTLLSLAGKLEFWRSIEPQNEFVLFAIPKIAAIVRDLRTDAPSDGVPFI